MSMFWEQWVPGPFSGLLWALASSIKESYRTFPSFCLHSSSNFELCTFSHAQRSWHPQHYQSKLTPSSSAGFPGEVSGRGLPSSRPIAWPLGLQLLILTQQTYQAESYPAPWQQEPRARSPVDLHSCVSLRRCARCRRRPGAGRAPPPSAGVGDTGSPPLLPVRSGWGMLAYPLPVASWRGQSLSWVVAFPPSLLTVCVILAASGQGQISPF